MKLILALLALTLLGCGSECADPCPGAALIGYDQGEPICYRMEVCGYDASGARVCGAEFNRGGCQP